MNMLNDENSDNCIDDRSDDNSTTATTKQSPLSHSTAHRSVAASVSASASASSSSSISLSLCESSLSKSESASHSTSAALKPHETNAYIPNAIDQSSERESIPVVHSSASLHRDIRCPFPWLNEFNDESPPRFRLISNNESTQAATAATSGDTFKHAFAKSGCKCKKGCSRNTCSCMRRGGGYSYENNKLPIASVDGVNLFECNSSCACACAPGGCGNRVTQQSASNKQYEFYLFYSSGKQWGVKCAQSLPSGTYIGQYTGIRMTEDEAQGDEDSTEEYQDHYMFLIDTNSMYPEDMKELKTVLKKKRSVAQALQEWPRITIDALHAGHLVRFVNHSCQPNVTAVQVFTENRAPDAATICYFTRTDVPAHTELNVSYHYERNSRSDQEWPFVCNCNTDVCQHPLKKKQRLALNGTAKQSQ